MLLDILLVNQIIVDKLTHIHLHNIMKFDRPIVSPNLVGKRKSFIHLMIDLVQYRCRIGTFTGRGDKGCGKGRPKKQFTNPSAFNPYNRPGPIKFFKCDNSGACSENTIHNPLEFLHQSLQITFYSYIMLIFIFFMLSIVSCHTFIVSIPHASLPYINFKISILSFMHIKIGYFCILSTVILKYMCLGKTSLKYAKKIYRIIKIL